MSFAGRPLFKDISFGIESGDHIGLIGPNGAGKSTLLKIISSKIKADSGTLSLQQGLSIAYLEQNPQVNLESTVNETIMEGAHDPHDWQAIAQAQEMMSHLNFEAAGISDTTLMSELSGGWKKKVAFIRECLRNPALMLLDEPTNHLDVESILWLEEFLSNAPFATLTVTHDRLFLNRISKKIWELDFRNPNGLLVVEGDFVSYCEVKENMLHALERQETTMRNTLRRETEWLRRGPKARTTKQQARIERAHDLADDVQELAELNKKREVNLKFVGAEKNPKKLIEAKNLSKAYDGRTIIKNFNLYLSPGNKIGILGANGAGKSTLLKLLLGLEKSDTGHVQLSDDLSIAYFEQNRESLDPNASVVQTICPAGDHVKFNGNYVHVRSYLDRFLFSAEKMLMPVSKLSGGEQSRLLIARLMLKEANILVLDEPTNDLDMVTLNILEDRLIEFPGAILLVTHDRYFMHRVATQILAIDQKHDPGHVESFSTLEQWEAWQKEQASSKGETSKAEKKSQTSKPSQDSNKENTKESKKKIQLTYNEQRELDLMESKIHKAEKEIETLSSDETPKSAEVYKQIGELQKEVEKLYARWAELEQKKP